MSTYKIIVTDDRYGRYDEENTVLGEIGAEAEIHNLASEKEAAEVLRDADGVLVNLFPLTAGVIEGMKQCRVISRYGVGYDNVDVQAARKAGITVTRVPDYSIEDVSDHALGLLLGCIRKVAYKDRMIREGRWNLHNDQRCYRIRGKVLGLIGFGAIAKALRRKVSGFGLSSVLVYDPYIDESVITAEGCRKAELDELLQASDYVSIHVPLMEATKNLISKEKLGLMKNGGILINTSRGPVVNESDLCDALQNRRIAGAGLDVFTEEPLPEESCLRGIDSVILSDHAGWYTEESIVELKTKAARNIVEVIQGKTPTYPVP